MARPWIGIGGAYLNLWTGRAIGLPMKLHMGEAVYSDHRGTWSFDPARSWKDCGPLLETYIDSVVGHEPQGKRFGVWACRALRWDGDGEITQEGLTPQEAICRAVCEAKWPDGVPDDVPEAR